MVGTLQRAPPGLKQPRGWQGSGTPPLPAVGAGASFCGCANSPAGPRPPKALTAACVCRSRSTRGLTPAMEHGEDENECRRRLDRDYSKTPACLQQRTAHACAAGCCHRAALQGPCGPAMAGTECARLQVPYPHDPLAAADVAHAGEEEQLRDGSPARRLHARPNSSIHLVALRTPPSDKQPAAVGKGSGHTLGGRERGTLGAGGSRGSAPEGCRCSRCLHGCFAFHHECVGCAWCPRPQSRHRR